MCAVCALPVFADAMARFAFASEGVSSWIFPSRGGVARSDGEGFCFTPSTVYDGPPPLVSPTKFCNFAGPDWGGIIGIITQVLRNAKLDTARPRYDDKTGPDGGVNKRPPRLSATPPQEGNYPPSLNLMVSCHSTKILTKCIFILHWSI